MKKRYVILPLKGISGPAMAASVFQTGGGRLLPEVFKKDVRPLVEGIPESSGIAQATPATVELSGIVADEDFATLSQRFPDGPAVVSMTDAGRRAFEASFPSLRVLPITTYHLPGRSPRSKRAKPEGAVVAGQSAVAAGQVFTADAKQRFLTAASAGAGGRGVRVGVLDTGVDNAHPALAPAVSMLRCYIPDAPPTAGGPVNWGPALLERSGHGTHVAGIIAARDGHGGPAGVAPEAEIVSYRIFPDNPSRQMGAENAVIIDSIRAAIDDGCHIINLSIEGPSLKEDGVRTAVSDAWAQGVVCIAAAGNGFGNPVSYPAALQHCVAVTAIGHDDAFPHGQGFEQHVSNQRATADPKIFLASFSNFGPPVQFTAPGHAIVSTFPGGGWWFDSGTSMAAPFISGVLARLLSTNSNILNMRGNADRSAAMLQMLVGRARMLKLPQAVQEGYGLPL
jgi:subtilisin family serine protease